MNSLASQGSVGFLFDYISATEARDKFAFLHKNNHKYVDKSRIKQ